MTDNSEIVGVQVQTEKQANARLTVRIDGFIKRAQTVANDAHVLLCDTLDHASKFGDARLIDRLISGLPSALRPVAARDWVKKFSPVTWNGDGQVGIIKATSKLYKEFDLEAAKLEPYWTPEENKAGKMLTLEALIAMAQRIETETEKKIKSGQIEEGQDIDAMRLFAKRITAASKAVLVVDNSTLATKVTIAEPVAMTEEAFEPGVTVAA